MKLVARTVLAGLALSLASLGAAQAQAPAAAAGPPDAVRGETLFKQRCALCHSLVVDTTKRPGPSLQAVINRNATTTRQALDEDLLYKQ